MDLHILPIPETEDLDKFVIFRPLLGLAFVGNEALVNLAINVGKQMEADIEPDGPTEIIAFLRRVGFLQPDPPSPLPTPATFWPTMAVLLMTNQCQLRCTYCYAAAGERPAEALSVEQGKTAIDTVCANAEALSRPSFEVSFHGGGEPTFAWQTLQTCTAYARQKSLTAKISLTSNGVWSTRQREWIVNNIDSVTISLDGDPETQNRQRPFASGTGSAAIVMETVAALDQHRIPYGIRMTATPPWEPFVDGVRYICTETGCRSIQVEPTFNTQRGGHGAPQDTEHLAFAEAFITAATIANEAGRQLVYSGARLGTIITSFCTAPYNALIVSPGGTLVSCYEVTDATHPLAPISTIGHLAAETFRVDETARARLHTLIAERRAACRDCFCYWSCAGDCYTRTFGPEVNGHQKRGVRCVMNKTITRKLLLGGISAGDGVWRRRPHPTTMIVAQKEEMNEGAKVVG